MPAIRLPKITKTLVAVVIFFLCGFFARPSLATDPAITGRATVRISDVGVAETQISLRTQINEYNLLKQLGSNFNLLARQIGMDDRNWNRLDNLTGRFIDAENSVDMSFSTPGAARNTKGDTWVYALHGNEKYQLVSATDSHVTLMQAEATEIGLGTMILDVELPAGAKNAAYNRDRNEITFEFEPSVTNGANAELDFVVHHKSQLMSCLAKNYSNPNFNFMWAAKAEVKNTGDQVLNNYRVRFRVAEMGSWSPWCRTARVYPGQTVVDPFFPIFDLDRIMAMNGSRPAVIEVEYEYEQADGKKVEETDSFPVQMLSRNEVIFSSLESSEITGFHDQFDYAPALMTAMTTPADPVVQQLAGQINGMAAETFGQTIAAIESDDECLAFMSAMQHFVKSNRIAYQSPPGTLTLGNHGQHIKYSRDVLRNRAGTCVDLAILWASVCEAVGLEPGIVLIPGHAFPAVKLPGSKRWVAIESTMVNDDFKAALEKGMAELEEAQKGEHYLVDVHELRTLGVLGLDLPNVSENYLTNLGYTFNCQVFQQNEQDQQNQQTEIQAQTVNGQVVLVETTENNPQVTMNPNGGLVSTSDMVGTFGGWGVDTGRKTWVGVALNGDGSFEVLLQYYENDGSRTEDVIRGTWGKRDDKLVFNCTSQSFDYVFEFTGNTLKLCILGGEQVVLLERQS